MRCFSMLEGTCTSDRQQIHVTNSTTHADVVPVTRPLHKAIESREKFLKRQIADNPALITPKVEEAPNYDPNAPLVPYPSASSTPWEVTPNGTPAPGGSKRTKSAPKKDKDKDAAPAPQPRKSTGAVKTDAEKEADRERRASARQRDKAGRFSQGEDNATASAPPAASAPAPTAPPPAAAPAASAGNGTFSPFGPPPQADEGAPFATNTGRTIYSQR